MNESLYILKIDILVEYIKKIEYEVYYNFSSNKLTKLNLTVCKGIKIDILIPKDIPINEIDKYNKSSGFYNDICYTYTSEFDTDESLKDRRNDYNNNNLSICEEGCDFTEYNSVTKKVKCSCFTKITLPLISEIKLDKQKLISNFKDIRNVGNFKILSCLKKFLKEKNIFKNTAYHMLIIIFILSLISVLTFCFYDFKKIQEYIINYENKKNEKIKCENIRTTNKEENRINYANENSFNISSMIKITKRKKVKKKNKILKKNLTKNENKVKLNHIVIEKSENTINKQTIIKEKLEIYNDFELNELEYDDALKKDNRTFLKLYISFLKTNHLLIFSFFTINDYNSYSIKIFIFFFTFSMNLVTSAMFYSDETMHKIYIDKGEFDYTYQLPQMFYSYIISTLLENILNHLGLYEQDVVEFKKDIINMKNKIKVLIKIKTKIILFFIIDYILLVLFWLYLGCFCYVYKNTQVHLLIDVLSSFTLSFISPFFIILFSSFIRKISLKNKDKNKMKSILFKFSNFLLNFF